MDCEQRSQCILKETIESILVTFSTEVQSHKSFLIFKRKRRKKLEIPLDIPSEISDDIKYENLNSFVCDLANLVTNISAKGCRLKFREISKIFEDTGCYFMEISERIKLVEHIREIGKMLKYWANEVRASILISLDSLNSRYHELMSPSQNLFGCIWGKIELVRQTEEDELDSNSQVSKVNIEPTPSNFCISRKKNLHFQVLNFQKILENFEFLQEFNYLEDLKSLNSVVIGIGKNIPSKCCIEDLGKVIGILGETLTWMKLIIPDEENYWKRWRNHRDTAFQQAQKLYFRSENSKIHRKLDHDLRLGMINEDDENNFDSNECFVKKVNRLELKKLLFENRK